MINLFNYIDRPSQIHRLTGACKLVCLITWSLAAMTSFYTPLLIARTIGSFILFRVANLKVKDISFMLGIMFAYILLNNVLIFLFSPDHGTSIYGTETVLFRLFGPYVVTAEQLFYHLNVILKNACTIPIVLLFICTTNPSEFAASLNGIKVSYKASYALALTLRYFPDTIRNYGDISIAQQSRGLDLSKKEKLGVRIKNVMNICVPLIFSTMDRIDVISNAMDLRAFGKHKKRTWYAKKPMAKLDYICIGVCVFILLAVILIATFINHGRFWNPFI